MVKNGEYSRFGADLAVECVDGRKQVGMDREEGRTRMRVTVPAWGARTSMVTLSVSIWAITSSSATESPAAFPMFTTVPARQHDSAGIALPGWA